MIVRASGKRAPTWPRGWRSGRRRSRSFATGSRRRSRTRSRSCGFRRSTISRCVRRTCLSVRTGRSSAGHPSSGSSRTPGAACGLSGLCARRSTRAGWRSAGAAAAGRSAEAGGMTGTASVPWAIARFGSSRARTAWKACGQSLPALFAGVLFRAGIDHIQYFTWHLIDRRRSDDRGLRGCGPAWPRRQSATAGSAQIRSAEKRSHASGLDRGASNAKPGLDMPGRNCRTIGTQLIVEAANKVLVAQRMKRSGMRWRIRSGQAVLSFRVLQKSGLLDRTWSDLMAARAAAANENHPLPYRAIDA